MKIKNLTFILPVVLLMSCGGSESEETNENSEVEEEVVTEYNSTFETCAGENGISMTEDSLNDSEAFAFDKLNGVDLSTFTNYNAELVKTHKRVSIKLTNNPDILDVGIGSFNPGDLSLTLGISVSEGEIIAGEFNKDNADISLTKGEKVDGVIKTGGVGSNMTPKSVVINSISREHVCGSFIMTNEEGKTLLSMDFDTDLVEVEF